MGTPKRCRAWGNLPPTFPFNGPGLNSQITGMLDSGVAGSTHGQKLTGKNPRQVVPTHVPNLIPV